MSHPQTSEKSESLLGSDYEYQSITIDYSEKSWEKFEADIYDEDSVLRKSLSQVGINPSK